MLGAVVVRVGWGQLAESRKRRGVGSGGHFGDFRFRVGLIRLAIGVLGMCVAVARHRHVHGQAKQANCCSGCLTGPPFILLHTHHLAAGTPLQNNLKELWSLLSFIMPDVFRVRGRMAGRH